MKIFPTTKVVENTDKLLHLNLAPDPILTLVPWIPLLFSLIFLFRVDHDQWGSGILAGVVGSLLFAGIGFAPHGFGHCIFNKTTGETTITRYSLFQRGAQNYELSEISGVSIYKESEALFSVSLEVEDRVVLLQSGMEKDKAEHIANVISEFLSVTKSYAI